MRILLSNDDGIDAKGISVLSDVLSKQAEITVVAPDRNRSGASNSLTLDMPLKLKKISRDRIKVEGTPTDCVHLAITGLLDKMPDMVISGINEGANLGDDVLYSGTVAAAIEGRFLGLPAIAVSLLGNRCEHYETAAHVVELLVSRLIKDPLPADTILNVNVPDIIQSELRGFEVTRLGSRHRSDQICEQKNPWGNNIYWIGPAGEEADAGPGTDFYAVNNKKVSITPLHVDLTHYEAFDQVAKWITKFN